MSWLDRLAATKRALGFGFDGRTYWDDRARKHGVHSVLNLLHDPADFEKVTTSQRNTLFPLLAAQLNGRESRALDFGCGPGRFTPHLARLIDGTAVGLDVSKELIDLAPADTHVTYRLTSSEIEASAIEKYDLIWVCLVLGGISSHELPRCVKFIHSSLNPDGLLFLVENTSTRTNQKHWAYRTAADYQAMFRSISLKRIGFYQDLGEEISVFAGRLYDD